MKLIRGTMIFVCLILGGCGVNPNTFSKELKEIANHTKGDVNIRVDIGTFGKKVTVVFNNVDKDAL